MSTNEPISFGGWPHAINRSMTRVKRIVKRAGRATLLVPSLLGVAIAILALYLASTQPESEPEHELTVDKQNNETYDGRPREDDQTSKSAQPDGEQGDKPNAYFALRESVVLFIDGYYEALTVNPLPLRVEEVARRYVRVPAKLKEELQDKEWFKEPNVSVSQLSDDRATVHVSVCGKNKSDNVAYLFQVKFELARVEKRFHNIDPSGEWRILNRSGYAGEACSPLMMPRKASRPTASAKRVTLRSTCSAAGTRTRYVEIDYPQGEKVPCKSFYYNGVALEEVGWANVTSGVCERFARQVIEGLTRSGFSCSEWDQR